MELKQSKFTLRVNSTLLKKFHFTADYNARSANKELELLMKKRVEEFEHLHGEIDLQQTD